MGVAFIKLGNYQDQVSWKILKPQRAVPVSEKKTEGEASAIPVTEKNRKQITKSSQHCTVSLFNAP